VSQRRTEPEQEPDATFQIEAEQSVIGCVLLEGELILELTDLPPEAFYRESHRRVWTAIRQVHERGLDVDLLTVHRQLEASGELEAIGGFGYLSDLGNSVPSTANMRSYLRLVQDAWRRRTVRALLTRAVRDTADWTVDLQTLTGRVTAAAMLLAGEKKQGGRVALETAMQERLTELDEIRRKVRKPLIDSSGWPRLDPLTMPWERGNLIQLTAVGTGVGKTSAACQIAFHVACEDRGVLYLSNEMSRTEIADRFLTQIGEMSAWRMSHGMVNEHEFEILVDLAGAVGELSPGHIWVDDSIRTTADVAASVHRTLLEHKKLHLVVLDYFQQLSDPVARGQTEAQVLGASIKALKQLAMDTEIVLLFVSQTNRGQRAAQKGREDEDELDESQGWAAGAAAIDNASDQILVIQHGKARKGKVSHPCRFHVVKHRGGPKGFVRLWWRPGRATFQSSEEDAPEASEA
jgi:replicative DNA helicase